MAVKWKTKKVGLVDFALVYLGHMIHDKKLLHKKSPQQLEGWRPEWIPPKLAVCFVGLHVLQDIIGKCWQEKYEERVSSAYWLSWVETAKRCYNNSPQ